MKIKITFLALLFFVCAALILNEQKQWQLNGRKNARFMKVTRRVSSSLAPEKANITDCRNRILAKNSKSKPYKRIYPFREALAHPVGYSNKILGSTGCEQALDAELSINSKPFKLTIDAELQRYIYKLLSNKAGAVVVMEPATGKIKALVSAPSFNPEEPSKHIHEKNASLLNRAISGLYPPGSVFKPFVAAAALSEKIDRFIYCPANGYYPSRHAPPIRDNEFHSFKRRGKKWHGFGKIDIVDAIAHSSNVYFAQLSVLLGKDKFNKYLEKSKLRNPISILTLADSSLDMTLNRIPDSDNILELTQSSIGQGTLGVTPLTIALITASIANGGFIPYPTLNENAKPKILSKLFSLSATKKVSDGMRKAVTSGTSKACNINGLQICGKTGTAQNGTGQDHSWFTCFVPQNNPTFVITVVVEYGGYGAKSALPVAKNILLKLKSTGALK